MCCRHHVLLLLAVVYTRPVCLLAISAHPCINAVSHDPQDAFFDRRQIVSVPRGDFAVYTAGEGSSALVLLHGGGMSSESFGPFSKEVVAKLPGYAVVAIDFRGHGSTAALPEAV